MKVLLVTTVDKLAEKFAALSPELEYCTVVVDEVEPAKEIFAQVGLSKDLLQPMSELKNCVESLDYDYVLCVQNQFYDDDIIMELPKYAVSKNNILSFGALSTRRNFLTEQALRYYQKHWQDFEMFATGISTVYGGIDVTQFNRKLFNVAKPSQDLYYDYNVAKHIFVCGGGIVRYAMLSSGLCRILFITTFRKFFVTDVFSCRILLLLMTCIIFSCPPMFIRNFSVKNGWLKNIQNDLIRKDLTAPAP